MTNPDLTVIGGDGVTMVQETRSRGESGSELIVQTWRGEPTATLAFYDANKSNAEWGSVVYNNRAGKREVVLTQTAAELAMEPETGGGPGTALGSEGDVWEMLGEDRYLPLGSWDEWSVPEYTTGREQARNEYEKGNALYTPAEVPIQTFLAALRLGIEEFLQPGMMLQLTRVVSSRSALTLVWPGSGKAWTLAGEDGSPSPPSELIGAITGHPDANLTDKQWLKMAPTLRHTQKGVYEMSQRWTWDKAWSATFYDGTGVP